MTAAARRLARHSQARVGGALLLVLVVAAAFAPWLSPHDPYARNVERRLQPPSAAHWMGTDELGRDVFARVLAGARTTLYAGGVSVAIAATLGTVMGLVAGYSGGRVDWVLSGLIDVMLAFPSFLLALAVIAVLGPSLSNAVLAVGVRGIPVFARLVRASAIALRDADFVDAARAAGATPGRVMTRHLLPNVLPSVLVLASLQFPGAILTIAGLSFIGLGAQPPSPEWGRMLASARAYLTRAPWLVNVPGLAIVLTVLALNLVGNALRDTLDPKLRGAAGG